MLTICRRLMASREKKPADLDSSFRGLVLVFVLLSHSLGQIRLLALPVCVPLTKRKNFLLWFDYSQSDLKNAMVSLALLLKFT